MFTLHPTTKIFRQSFCFQKLVAKEGLAKDNSAGLGAAG
jgi:hypothetical protein